MTRYLPALALVLAGAALAIADGSLLNATATGPTVLGVPWTRAAAPRIWIRGSSGPWQPAAYKQAAGRLVFELDPARLGGPTALLLINPPADLVLNDDRPPALVGLKVDGQAQAAVLSLDLGSGESAPRSLVAAFRDTENRVDASSLRVLVDGEPLGTTRATVRTVGKALRVAVQLPELDYGKHEVTLAVSDTSPQANAVTLRLKLQRLDTTNMALATLGATVTVDSCFSGYESLTPLNDGSTTMPGDSCGNDITWASAETETDHWAEVRLPQPKILREVTIFWAAYTEVKHTPKYFEVQTPRGEGWEAIYKSPAAGEKPRPATTARFCPLTTDRFRIFMPKGMGSESRPRLLWIGEVRAR